MQCFPFAAAVMRAAFAGALCGLVLSGCDPTFNWREVRQKGTDLVALLPCKPDSVTRSVSLAGQTLDLHMSGCDAGGATFAVSWVSLSEPARNSEVMSGWRDATLANLRATAPRDAAFVPKGALGLSASVQTVAVGRRPDGLPVLAHAAWFARGAQVFHAVVYADRLSPEVAEAFFAGITFP